MPSGGTREPASRGVRPNGMHSPLARIGLWLALLAVAVPLTAACASQAGGGGNGAASCVALIKYQGHDYLGHGDLKRDPATTGRQVTATIPGCDDTGGQGPADPDETVKVNELADVPLETAFLGGNGIYIREGRELPAATRIWFRAPRCATAGRFRLVTDWLGVTSRKKPRFDGDIRAPYRLEVHVNKGPGKYLGTTITVHADATAQPALGPKDVKASLWEGRRLVVVASCDDDRFQALSLWVPQR